MSKGPIRAIGPVFRKLAAALLAAFAVFCALGAASASAQVNTLCISRLNDLSATVIPGSGTIDLADSSILIEKRRNNPGAGNTNYSVTAQGSAGGGFNLSGPSGALLPYSVYWANSAGITTPTSATQLTHNTAASFTGALLLAQGTSLPTCGASGGANNASVIVRFNATDINAASNGVYSGTLTLLIGP